MAKGKDAPARSAASEGQRPQRIDYVRRASNHIDVGSWSICRDTWTNYLPSTISAGRPPEKVAGDWEDFQRVAEESKSAPINKPALGVVLEGLHEMIFRESVFQLHKAWHVLGAAERHAGGGQPTWAQSSGYQAAFFAAKATLGILGHPLIEYQNRMCLARLFPVEERSKSKGGPIHNSDTAEIIYLDKSFSHREIWELYQRMINTAVVDDSIWPSATKDFLTFLSPDDFASERNALHYDPSNWIFGDLLADHQITDLAKPDTKDSRWTFPTGGFSMCLGERCFHLGRALLLDLSKQAPSLVGETDLFSNTSTAGRHPYYFSTCAPPNPT